MDKSAAESKKCCKCGKPFTCLHNEDCWCMKYVISPENLKRLKETYDNCLCPSCLQEFAVPKNKL